VADVVVTADGAWVVTSNVEAERLAEEEVPGFEVVSYPWADGPDAANAAIAELARGTAVLSDMDASGAAAVAPLRLVLDDAAVTQYRSVGADARAAMEEAAAALSPAMTERAAAAVLAGACRERGLFSPVLLAAGAARVARFRHPLPTDAALGGVAMLVVCAERHGLYANLTRWVAFDGPDPETARRIEVCESVLAAMRAATRPGATLGDVFAVAQSAYADAGFEGEWRNHHQGATTSRER
jgi:Xaa-Pro aminopeptidase